MKYLSQRMGSPKRVVIVGGGASGMVAALAAARHGAQVTVFENYERVGRKLLATGNGRCNLTNMHVSYEHYTGGPREFVAPLLAEFTPDTVRAFFAERGVLSRVEEDGRVYPVTGQAATVLDALRAAMEQTGVDIVCGSPVAAVSSDRHTFVLAVQGGTRAADRVVVAAGGSAAPHLGGSDRGVQLLAALGHGTVPTAPALVPLRTNPAFGPRVKGVKVRCAARLDIDGRTAAEQRGETQFAEYGLSGIPLFQFSLRAAEAIRTGTPVAVVLDLVPELDERELTAHLRGRMARCGEGTAEAICAGTVHKRLLPLILQTCDIAPRASLREQDLPTVASALKQWRFAVSGTLGWREAQVMAGGVSAAQFSPLTLESKLVPGLYACGEVLDVTGECGGYNLHWAWISGLAAGAAAAV